MSARDLPSSIVVHPRREPMPATHRLIAATIVASAAAVTVVAPSLGTAAPIGPLPSGPASTIETRAGELVAVALPHRANGRVWRIAGAVAPAVLRQVSEADVGDQVVLVFKTVRPGK